MVDYAKEVKLDYHIESSLVDNEGIIVVYGVDFMPLILLTKTGEDEKSNSRVNSKKVMPFIVLPPILHEVYVINYLFLEEVDAIKVVDVVVDQIMLSSLVVFNVFGFVVLEISSEAFHLDLSHDYEGNAINFVVSTCKRVVVY